MKKNLAILLLLPLMSFAQENMISADGDHIPDLKNDIKFLSKEIAYSKNVLQQNIDPGIDPEGDYLGLAAFSPDGQKVILTNRMTDMVTVFDFTSMTTLANIEVGQYPSCVATTDSYFIVGCQFSDHVYIIDAYTYDIVDSILTGEQPCKIHVDLANNKAFVGCDIDDVCNVIDLNTLTIENTIPDFPIYLYSFGMATQNSRNYIRYSDFLITPDGQGVIMHNGEDKILYFDVATGNITNSISIQDPRMLGFSGDNGTIVCGAAPNNIARLYRIDFPGFVLQDSLDIPGYNISTREVAVNQDGTKAYVGTNNNSSHLINFANQSTQIFTSTKTAFWVGTSHDHQYAISGQWSFAIIDFENEVMTDLSEGISQNFGIVSPVAYHVFSYDAISTEDGLFYDFTDPDDIQLMGAVPSGEVPEGDAPYRVAFVPNSSIAVTVNNVSGNGSVIDYQSKDILAVIELGEACYDVIITNDGNYAVFGGYNNNTVKVVDLNTYQIVKELNVGQRPMELTYDPLFNTVFAANIKSNTITKISLNGANSTVVGSLSCGVIGVYIPFFGQRSGVEISPNSDYLLVAASFDDKVKVIDAISFQVVADLAVGDFPLSIGFNSSGDIACVTNLFDNSYSIINLDGANSTVLGTWSSQGDYPTDVTYSQSEDLFYITNYYQSDNVIKVDPATGNIEEVVNLSQYGGAYQVEFRDGEPVFLVQGNNTYNPGILHKNDLVELPASGTFMNFGEFNGHLYAGVPIPGPDYLSLIDLDFNVGINIPVAGKDELLIYPNPAKDCISVRTDRPVDYIEIVDQAGKSIHRYSSARDMEIADIRPGLYFVKVVFLDAGSKIVKVIIHD